MGIQKVMLIASTVLLTAGCAQLDALNWPTNLEGRAAALDAKQRVVFSKSMPVAGSDGNLYNTPVICAEPSPDALSAYSSSLSAGIKTDKAAQAQLALALAEQTASIGLRTQSIQLLRDAMFRACEAYFGHGINQGQFYALQRRFQNLTLGLLAIEQLTGTVKAGQVQLNSSSGSAVAGDTQVETEAYETALDKQVEAEADRVSAQEKADESATAAQKALEGKRAALTAFQGIKSPSSTDIATKDAAVDLAATTEKNRTTDARALDLAKSREEKAIRMVKVAKDNLDLASARLKSIASGDGIIRAAKYKSAETDQVATKVYDILDRVFEESGNHEICYSIISDFITNKAEFKDNKDAMQAVQNCIYLAAATEADQSKAAAKAGIGEAVIPGTGTGSTAGKGTGVAPSNPSPTPKVQQPTMLLNRRMLNLNSPEVLELFKVPGATINSPAR